ncbi:MAG: sulfite:cytochrome oxidoreductase subunit [Hyphomicrobiales bacterium]|nr:sulfite:cytochrome oxidoreductase subunit [Hyphomicrobiales bacterium]
MPKFALASCLAAGVTTVGIGLATASPVTYKLPEETATFRPGSGVEAAKNNCSACHSADYVSIQPPKKGKAFWEAEVTKMIKTYKAQITDADTKTIADYLAIAY